MKIGDYMVKEAIADRAEASRRARSRPRVAAAIEVMPAIVPDTPIVPVIVVSRPAPAPRPVEPRSAPSPNMSATPRSERRKVELMEVRVPPGCEVYCDWVTQLVAEAGVAARALMSDPGWDDEPAGSREPALV